jgi:hypothetical protein
MPGPDRKDRDVTMSTKAIGIGVVVVVMVATVLFFIWPQDDTEDRPPIIVKGSSIEFTIRNSEDKKIKWSKKDFTRREWKPAHRKGKPVRAFTVVVQGAVCDLPAGPTVTFVLEPKDGTTVQFTVLARPYQGGFGTRGKPEPKVAAMGNFNGPDFSDDRYRMSFADVGKLLRVEVGGKPCDLSGSAAPEITVDYQYE